MPNLAQAWKWLPVVTVPPTRLAVRKDQSGVRVSLVLEEWEEQLLTLLKDSCAINGRCIGTGAGTNVVGTSLRIHTALVLAAR
jgi:hypothetical protein